MRSQYISLIALLLSHLHVATIFAEPPLTIQLVSDVTSITPGQPFYVGLALHHAPGYHTYWKSGGIVGVPTNIKWQKLPRGFKASEIEWPAPEATKMYQIKCQGYERDVVLPILITPPAHLQEGSTVRLAGKAAWMACHRECNPGFADLSIELLVKTTPQPAYDTQWHPRIEKERAHPIRESASWAATATVKASIVTLTLTPQTAAAHLQTRDSNSITFFTEDGSIDSDKAQTVQVDADGSVRLALALPDYLDGKPPKRLAAVLVRQAGWLSDGTLQALRIAPELKRD